MPCPENGKKGHRKEEEEEEVEEEEEEEEIYIHTSLFKSSGIVQLIDLSSYFATVFTPVLRDSDSCSVKY
jgi:hypothetical protein